MPNGEKYDRRRRPGTAPSYHRATPTRHSGPPMTRTRRPLTPRHDRHSSAPAWPATPPRKPTKLSWPRRPPRKRKAAAAGESYNTASSAVHAAAIQLFDQANPSPWADQHAAQAAAKAVLIADASHA